MKNIRESRIITRIVAFAVTTILIFGCFPTSVAATYPVVSSASNTYIIAFTISTLNNTPAFSDKSLTIKIGTIYATDDIFIYEINDSFVYCSYPTSSGRKWAYISTNVITTSKISDHSVFIAKNQITTYRRASTENAFGYISQGDQVTKIATNGSFVQVIYPISGKCFKMAWIRLEDYNKSIISNSNAVMPSTNSTTTGQRGADWAIAQIDKMAGNGQCVALIKAYYTYLGVTSVTGNGCDYATNSLPSGWQRIKNTPDFIPQPGDIAVWTSAVGGGYGHVAIILEAGLHEFTSVDQNWNGLYAHKVTHNYSNFWGVIRPKF